MTKGDGNGNSRETASEKTSSELPPVQPGPESTDRMTQPIDTEQPPRLPFPVVGIGASAGGLEAITDFLDHVPPDTGMAYVFIQHLPPTGESMLAEILAKHADIPVLQVDDKMPVEPNHLYVIRPGHTLTIKDGVFRLGERVATPMHNRPIDDFFKSLAVEQRERAIAIIMSGMGSNGTAGAQAVKAVGGLCVAQELDSTEYPSMPRHLIDSGYADFILLPKDMPAMLLEYADHPYAKGEREEKAILAKRDQQHLGEVLAILRTRTHQDFTGYKKPTILRRIQRRMGLNRLTELGDYAKMLRQAPSEISALSDDLLIHVTGFFCDSQAWETLRQRVIVPLVASRENDQSIRCWVTACSSGEEAYTLAILIMEEAERAEKILDIKVFATDMADRGLQNARAGTYPGGIEAEITPERLDRFFEKEDAVYRVRPELRERVVFAPQNLLQDPPFSRLDIISCRNLLIYLEPEMQQRILGLLHFGLREGGALFLGTSETVNYDNLFEPIDKHARIFRRVGRTRQGAADFPFPRHLLGAKQDPNAPVSFRTGLPAPRPSMAQMVNRSLVDYHTPAAVVIDRDHRIVFYHGNTEPFISLPRGEPTRELLEVVRESVRGAVRTAIGRATGANAAVTVLDGWIEMEPGRQVRIAVTASPLDPKNARDHLVVSFQERGEAPSDQSTPAPQTAGPTAPEELQRVREELQSTIEELQTSNEELKASHEEVVSTNEELQSSNEELETSREEMQSLNEELNTVNAQLRAKMEEHQAVSNDLASLLVSSDIAVLFLDTRLRIRRFTPAVRDLFDMIATDVGRPLKDLARKFDDRALDDDAVHVLEQLVPLSREVAAANGRHYQRRVLPYRTVDNRIEGLVVTFVDITERKKIEEESVRAKEYAENIVETVHEPLLVLDSDLAVRSANPAFYKLFKVSPEQTKNRKIFELGNGQWNIPSLRKLFDEILPADKVFNGYEVSHDFEGLGQRVMILNGRKLEGGGRILLGIRDVTTQRHADALMRRNEERLRRMVNIPGVGVLQFAAAGTLIEANNSFLQMTGYSREDIASKKLTWRHMTPREYVAESEQQLAVLQETGRIGPYEKEYICKDGSRAWFLFAGASLGDKTIIEYCIDVSDRKRAEKALRDSEERFRLLVEGTRDFAMLMLDAKGRVMAWNIGAERLLGYSEAEAVGQPGDIIFNAEDRAAGAPAQEMAQAIATGRAEDERWHMRKNGSRFWGSGVLAVLRAADGSVRGFVKVMRDETARRRAEDALQAAKDSAESANRVKDEFLAILSHELRTPLSAILLWVKMLHGRQPSPELLEEGLTAIGNSAEAQRQLVEDLLDTARITSGNLRLDMRRVELTALLQDAVASVRPTADARGVKLSADIADFGFLRADPDRLRQVIWNLLTNAIKFTPAQGQAMLKAHLRGRELEIQVSDNGRGIEPAFLPHIFEPFRQSESHTTRTAGGLGLGLSICKNLVELHGGTITAESPGPGKGATFTVRLPVMAASGSDLSAESKAPGKKPAASTPGDVLKDMKLLVVEDEPETRRAVETLLRSAGAQVTAVDSAEAALKAFQKSRPDLLVSDIGLPREDGYSLLRQIRQIEGKKKSKPLPAIALTAFVRPEDRQKALDAGYTHHVAKPFDPELLVSTIRLALKM